MLRLALCDDDREYLKLVEGKIKDYCRMRHREIMLECFSDSDLLATAIERERLFDAYILDIEMQDYSGVELAEMIRERSEMACILFLTAHVMYAVEACGMGIFRYLLKERLDQELPAALDSLFECLEQRNDGKVYLIINQRKYLKIYQNSIVYIYKDQKNSVFVLKNGREEQERLTIREVYKKLDSDREMFLLDRGTILNLLHVQKVTAEKVVMDNGAEFYANAAHIAALKRSINALWGELI